MRYHFRIFTLIICVIIAINCIFNKLFSELFKLRVKCFDSLSKKFLLYWFKSNVLTKTAKVLLKGVTRIKSFELIKQMFC